MKDVLELRERNWQLRNVAEMTTGAPKTLAQIHREAANEEQERTKYSAQMNAMPIFTQNYPTPMYGPPPGFVPPPPMGMAPYGYDAPPSGPHYNYDSRQNSNDYI